MIELDNLSNVRRSIKKILPNFFVKIIRKYLSEQRENKQLKILGNIKTNFKNIVQTNTNNIISELCEKYGSDKGFINPEIKKPYTWMPLSYTSYYHSIFSLSRENIKSVFECGLGTNNPKLVSNMTLTGKPGASLRVWRDYFVNANIYGGDIDKDILFEEDRIKTFYVNQLDSNSIKSMWKNINVDKFDIIIDDGLHTPEANLNFFFNSFEKLKNNGTYIIEDVKNKNIEYVKNELKDYDLEIVIISNKYQKTYGSSLIVIRKS